MRSIVGTWTLVDTEAEDVEGRPLDKPYGPKRMGTVSFSDEGWMMCVLSDGRGAKADGSGPIAYVSYCGHYTYDGETLSTKVAGTSDAARLGTDQVRGVQFEGERMILTPPAQEIEGVVRRRTLFWERHLPPAL